MDDSGIQVSVGLTNVNDEFIFSLYVRHYLIITSIGRFPYSMKHNKLNIVQCNMYNAILYIVDRFISI